MELGQRLDAICEVLGLSYAELSTEIGINRPDKFYHMKAGKSKPNYETIEAILKRFPNLNANFIFGMSEQIIRDSELEAETEARQITKGLTDDYEFLTTVKTMSKRILQLETENQELKQDNTFLNGRINDFIMHREKE